MTFIHNWELSLKWIIVDVYLWRTIFLFLFASIHSPNKWIVLSLTETWIKSYLQRKRRRFHQDLGQELNKIEMFRSREKLRNFHKEKQIFIYESMWFPRKFLIKFEFMSKINIQRFTNFQIYPLTNLSKFFSEQFNS